MVIHRGRAKEIRQKALLNVKRENEFLPEKQVNNFPSKKKRRSTTATPSHSIPLPNPIPGPIVTPLPPSPAVPQRYKHQTNATTPPALALLPTEALCGASPIVQRLALGSEDDKVCAALLSAPGQAAALLPRVCQLRPIMDRDSFVRVFYYSILPAILASRQPSWLLLRVRSGNPPIAVWEQESQPMGPSNADTRVMVAESEARRRLEQHATKGEASYALRIVVERIGRAHALIALISKGQAVLLDPNGTLQQATLCFGNAEVLLKLLRHILGPLGCSVTVSPTIPPLHSSSLSHCDQSYISGGACTLSSGAVALRAVLKGLTPMTALNELVTLSHADRTRAVTIAADALIALTLACHLARTKKEERTTVVRVADQLSSSGDAITKRQQQTFSKKKKILKNHGRTGA